MARPRYPSDEKRLVRPPGINVAFSIRNPDDPEQAKVFDNAELRGVWTGLLLIAGQAFAGRTSDRVTLSAGDLVWLTSRQSRAGAERLLARVCDHMGYELTSDSGRSWTVWVRNLSQNQGWAPRTPPESRAESAELPPPPSPIPIPNTNNGNRSESAEQQSFALAPRSARKARPKSPDKPKKPGHYATIAFREEVKAKRGKAPTVNGRDAKELGDIYEKQCQEHGKEQGDDFFRRCVRAYLARDEQWLRERAWGSRWFVQEIEWCSVRAQWDLEREQRPAPLEPPEGFDDLPEDLQQRGAALFGGADT